MRAHAKTLALAAAVLLMTGVSSCSRREAGGGYSFRMTVGTPADSNWYVVARPKEPGPKHRTFFVDSSGVIRYRRGADATSADTPLDEGPGEADPPETVRREESRAIATLKTIVTAQEQYKSTSGSATYATLEALASTTPAYLDAERVGVTPGASGGWTPPPFFSDEAAPPALLRSSERRADPAAAPAAPVRTWKRSTLAPNASRLSVGEQEVLPLKGAQAQVRVDGFRARVLMDLYFLNDRDRALEGTFQLRLPDDAAPYFFAFGETSYEAPSGSMEASSLAIGSRETRTRLDPADIMAMRADTWTRPKEARMTPREQAAFAYRETVHRVRVDPALMEWSGAGVFEARVFPLQPGRLHRVVVGYDADLVRAGGDLEFRLDLPAGDFTRTVDLDVAAIPGLSAEVSPKGEPFMADGRACYRFENPAEPSVNVRIKGAGPILLCGKDPKAGPLFAARFAPAVPEGPAGASRARAVFLVDASLSSNPERFRIWRTLLPAILSANRDEIREFAVLAFHVEAFWWREGFSENSPENERSAGEFLDTLALEGATDLGSALREAARPRWLREGADRPPADFFLLSDGASTWGRTEPSAIAAGLGAPPAGRLFAYATGLEGTDAEGLRSLSASTDGAVFSIPGESEVPAAARAHRSRPWRIEGVALEGGSDLLLSGRPRSIYPGQELLLAGRGEPAEGAEAVLTLKRDGEERIVRTRFGGTDGGVRGRRIRSDLAARLYGQIAVGQMEGLRTAGDAARAYACHFRITGRTCSLLMLESDADYARFGIRPEEDALVVRMQDASGAVAAALGSPGEAGWDPKAAFLAWLQKMERAPGISLRLETGPRLAIESLPAESFAFVPAPLACRSRARADLPSAIRAMLESRLLDGDGMFGEAERRNAAFGPADALKALSSTVEEAPGDSPTLRAAAFHALCWGFPAHAATLLERSARARPFEPQAYHALAVALEEAGNADLAIAYFEICLAGAWDARFGEFRRIAGMDYLRMLRRIAAGEVRTRAPQYARARRESVEAMVDRGPMDLRVTIAWNTDATDVDLHVVEPAGEDCHYANRATRIGGRLTQDVTQGFGPEMYTLPAAPGGTYRLKAYGFASDRNRETLRTTVLATIFEGWGTPGECVTRRVVRIGEGRDTQEIARVKRSGEPPPANAGRAPASPPPVLKPGA